MMLSPEFYIEQLKDKSYEKLLRERDYLIKEIRKFEKNKERSGEEWVSEPSPEVRYQINHLYLAKICELIAEKYSGELT